MSAMVAVRGCLHQMYLVPSYPTDVAYCKCLGTRRDETCVHEKNSGSSLRNVPSPLPCPESRFFSFSAYIFFFLPFPYGVVCTKHTDLLEHVLKYSRVGNTGVLLCVGLESFDGRGWRQSPRKTILCGKVGQKLQKNNRHNLHPSRLFVRIAVTMEQTVKLGSTPKQQCFLDTVDESFLPTSVNLSEGGS